MNARPSSRAFSLIEVLTAVALFVGSITLILALLPALTRQESENTDGFVAHRLPDAVKEELIRLAAPSLGTLAEQVPVMSDPLPPGFALVAVRSGARLHSRDYLPPVSDLIAETERYFRIECWRFPDGSLRYENGRPFLALCVRVTWPYGGPAAPAVAGHEFTFVVSLNQ